MLVVEVVQPVRNTAQKHPDQVEQVVELMEEVALTLPQTRVVAVAAAAFLPEIMLPVALVLWLSSGDSSNGSFC